MSKQKLQLEADVVICGAGTAGSAAALAAADQGADVLVIEQLGSPGGSGTLGLVEPLMSTRVPGMPYSSYIEKEIMQRMVKEGMASPDAKSFFDPTMLGFVLEEMLHERGVRMLYHTTLTGAVRQGRHIDHLEIFNKNGFGTVRARKKYIDCTGDADLCVAAGLPVLRGDDENHINQPCSLRYMVDNVDTNAFWTFLDEAENPGQSPRPRPENYSTAVTSSRSYPFTPLFDRAIADGELTQEDKAYWQIFTVPGRPGAIACNCPEFFDVPDTTDALALSRVQVQGKLAILRQLRFYRKHLRGFEHATISAVSAMVSIRESVRAVTEKILTAKDALGCRKFDDGIAQTHYPVDVHARVLRFDQDRTNDSDGKPWYEVPFGTLVVKGMDDLLVAGRNIGTDFIAQSSVRIIPTCRALGEAAGIAAALDTLDGKKVRAAMREKGAEFAE